MALNDEQLDVIRKRVERDRKFCLYCGSCRSTMTEAAFNGACPVCGNGTVQEKAMIDRDDYLLLREVERLKEELAQSETVATLLQGTCDAQLGVGCVEGGLRCGVCLRCLNAQLTKSERENQRLKEDNARLEQVEENIPSSTGQITSMRYALREIIKACGGIAELGVSTEFLCLAPAEIKIRMKQLSEAQRKARALDWLEQNVDDVTVFRDVSKGSRFEITYCASGSGCQVENSGISLLASIEAAIAQEKAGE